MRAAGFPATPEGQVDFEPPGTEDARLEAAAAREGQGGPSRHGERGEGGALAPPRTGRVLATRGAARGGAPAPPGTGGAPPRRGL